jgi:uncharacterized protein YjiK
MELKLKNTLFLFPTILLLSFSDINITLEKNIKINVKEPSALSFNINKTGFLTVGDSDSTIHELDFNGKTVKTIKTKASDLEGIVAHPDLNGYCFAEERIKKISCFDQNGTLIKSKSIPFATAFNLGFEGITYNSRNKHFYVVNEKKPTAVIELDSELNLIKSTTITNAIDLSDIFYDEKDDQFYILSHESKKIIVTDVNFNQIKSYGIPTIVQAEGLVVDKENNKIYVVSDDDSIMTTFSINH